MGRGSSGGRRGNASRNALEVILNEGELPLDDPERLRLNAYLNLDNAQGASVEHAIEKFQERYGSANHEYGALVDSDGYVISHVEGEVGRVNPQVTPEMLRSGRGGSVEELVRRSTFIHNHPSGSAFSTTDIRSFASSELQGLVATSNAGGTWRIERARGFNSAGLRRLANNMEAQFRMNPPQSSAEYNAQVARLLSSNAQRLGYRFTHTD